MHVSLNLTFSFSRFYIKHSEYSGQSKKESLIFAVSFGDHSLSCIGEGNGNPLQCSCLENPRDGGAWWAAVYGVAQSQTSLKRLSSSSLSIGEGNGTPLQYSCLENPMDGGAWKAAVHGVAEVGHD